MNILNHLAIIMDGNGRWAKNRSLVRTNGHKKGANVVNDIAIYCAKNNIKNLIPAYILSFSISFMLYVYEPILIYSTNLNDFWFDFKTMISVIPIYFFILFVGLAIGYTIIYLIN